MADNAYDFHSTHNTRNYNASLSRATRPPAYANEIQQSRPLKRAASGSAGTATSGSKRNASNAKRVKRTLNLVSQGKTSPAELARDAREMAGLAVSRQRQPLPAIPEEPECSQATAEVEEETMVTAPTMEHEQCGTPVAAEETFATSALPRQPTPEWSMHLDPDTPVAWNGMPAPPTREPNTTTPATESLPRIRTSQGKTATDYIRMFKDENLARTRTHAILRRSRPPGHSCRRCKRLRREARSPAWRCYDCTVNRDLCKACMRETHHANPYHRVGWWNGKFHQKAWLRDVGVAIFLCEAADPFTGLHCPSSKNFAGLPPGFDDETPVVSSDWQDAAGSQIILEGEGTGLGDADDMDGSGTVGEGEGSRWVEDGEGSRWEDAYGAEDVEGTCPQMADEEDEENEYQEPGSSPRWRESKAPSWDRRGLKTMVIVDVNHVHSIGVQFCSCPGARPRDEQLIEYGIYPASADRPSTGFTLHNLDYLRMDELECKTTPESYTKKVRRLTNPHDWRLVQNRYPETIRCDREYRACQALIQHGFAHQVLERWQDPGQGDLVHRCVTCPRPRGPFRNMPMGWEKSPYAWGYQYAWNIDGNFEAQHTASRSADNNVYLYPGTAMFNHPDEEALVLRDAHDDSDLAEDKKAAQLDCHEHKAAATVGKTRNSVMDIKGIGTICCARHGCLAAGGTNDFDCGECFPPVDLCLNKVWQNECDFDLVQRQLILYDIWCRFGINLKSRFEANGYSWPEVVETLQGIGVWHVYGHNLACFSRYAPLYAYRSGIVDGEIVETLWSLLNRILSSCRGMSLGNRRETIEAAMNDINYKKTICMVDTIARKWKRFLKEFPVREETLRALNEVTLPDDRTRWENTRREFEALRIRDPRLVDGMLDHPDNPPDAKALIRDILVETSGDPKHLALAKAVIEGHALILEQVRVAAKARQSGGNAPEDVSLASKRTRLRNRILTNNRIMAKALPLRDGVSPLQEDADDVEDLEDGEQADDVTSNRRPSLRYNLRDHAEHLRVDLPSSRRYDEDFVPSPLEQLAIGLELRLACVAMDVALSDLRRGLVDQAYIFRRDIRQSASSGNLKLGYDAAKKAREHARAAAATNRLFADMYRALRSRAIVLHWDKTSRIGRTAWQVHSDHYKVLSAHDIRCDTATYDVKDHSGRLDLPWFWKLDRRHGRDDVDDDEYIADFFRIRWIEARCAVVRCAEELVKLQLEMDTTYLGYHARADVWLNKAVHLSTCGSTYVGHVASAYANEDMWRRLADRAKTVFLSLSPSLPTFAMTDL